MDGVSDAPFRFITAKYGKPDVIITEFISVDGIYYGGERVFTDFLYHEEERPVVAQVFGIDPELFYYSAIVVCALGFDGLDINMGCPARNVASRGAGAGLIKTPKLAASIVAAAKAGIADYVNNGLSGLPQKLINKIEATAEKLNECGIQLPHERKIIPVSVKTRIGVSENVIGDWTEQLLQMRPANISIHGRTLKQMYSGKADWQAIKQAADIVKEYNKTAVEQITILGNGDINSASEAVTKIKQSGVDGVLIGRGSFGNPWIFKYKDQIKLMKNNIKEDTVLPEQRFATAIEHSIKHESVKGSTAFVQMRKHLAWYIKSFPGASELRNRLMQTNSSQEVMEILADNEQGNLLKTLDN